MPRRRYPILTEHIYHVFNRTQNKEPFFVNKRDCERVIKTLDYYSFNNLPTKFSYFIAYGQDKRKELYDEMKSYKKHAEIFCFCLMPTHFHLLLRQTDDNGISRFMSNFQNSITKYRNTKYKRDGHLFKGQFKAVIIEDNEQLLHVSRYIHLNPYSSALVENLNEIIEYPYSSIRQYLGIEEGFCNTENILSNFSTIDDYKKFVFDQADYQRKLKELQHLNLE